MLDPAGSRRPWNVEKVRDCLRRLLPSEVGKTIDPRDKLQRLFRRSLHLRGLEVPSRKIHRPNQGYHTETEDPRDRHLAKGFASDLAAGCPD